MFTQSGQKSSPQATAASTLNSLRSLFACTGLLQQLVSDNGRQFTGEEFQCFLRSNSIRHITSAPHHPATNGQAERFIQSFKRSMKASRTEGKPLQQKIDNFLLAYRNTTHATTGHTPAMLFMGWNLRSRLDLLKPDIRKDVQDKQSSMVEATRNKTRFFNVGQKDLTRDYRDPSQKWQSGTILSRTGPLTFTINVGANLVWRRQVDQILNAESHIVPKQPERTHLHLKIQKSLPSLHNPRFRVYVKLPMLKHPNFSHRALWTLTKQADVTLREIAEHFRD